MRYSTGLKVLAGVFVAGLLILVAGRQWREARELLAGALFVGAILAIGLLRVRPRRSAFQTEARRLGLRFSAKDPFDLLDEPFALMRWSQRSYGTLDNVVWGTWHGAPGAGVRVRVQCERGRPPDALLRDGRDPGGWPALVIEPESFVTRVADAAAPDIAFESEAFNRAFAVRGEDRRFANAFVDARMMEWLLSARTTMGVRDRGAVAPRLSRSRPTVGARRRPRDGRDAPRQGPARRGVDVPGGCAASPRRRAVGGQASREDRVPLVAGLAGAFEPALPRAPASSRRCAGPRRRTAGAGSPP